MHETGIAKRLLSVIHPMVDEKKRITRIKLRFGELKMVQKELLETAFSILTRGDKRFRDTILEIEIRPVRGKCNICRKEFDIKNFEMRCPFCGETSIDITGGYESEIVEMEVEDV
ncbi:MAG: hypothetical protein B6D65_02330 [candidate division Zixibacteria bacterium 4484_93]|nr:MAG: hypothetical protein B6D65_02330 [candidate division Zixibacteria bacterium 4484_93]